MTDFSIESTVVGPVMTNCYFMMNNDSGEMIVIDPGDDVGVLVQKIEKKGFAPKAILLTHGHFDHITASNDLRKRYGLPVYLHETEKKFLESEGSNPFAGGGENDLLVDEYLEGEPILNIAGFSIRTIHTPGHTPGGVCYYFADEKTLFCGDTLFHGSIGRTDFPYGDTRDLLRSVKEKLFILPEDTACYPGHDAKTTIGWEKKYNPFF